MKKNILYALLSNLITALCAWLMLWYLIRFGDITDVGTYGLAQAIALPVYMFFTFKLRTIQVTDTSNEYDNNDYLAANMLLAIINFLVAFVIFNFFYEQKILMVITALSFSYSLAIIREYYISLIQIKQRNDLLLVSNLFQNIFGLIVFIVVYEYFENIIFSIIAFSLSRIPALFIDNYFTKNFNNAEYAISLKNIINNKKSVKNLLKLGIPLGITAVIGSTFTSIPRIVLEKFENLEVLGIFTTLMSLVVAVNLFMSSFAQAILPKLSKFYQEDIKSFNKINLYCFCVLVCVLIFGLTFVYFYSEEILGMVFGEKYISYGHQFFMSMVSASILALFHYSNMLLNSIRYFGKQMYIYMISAIACLVSALILIPIFKIEGAIYSSMICSLIGFLVSILIFYYKVKSYVHKGN